MPLSSFIRSKIDRFSFPRLYWTTIFMEFLERGAYYTLLAVLWVHFAYNLEMSNLQIGILTSELYLLFSVVPVFGGAIAERIGYRKSLRISLTLNFAAYFLLGLFSILVMYHWNLGSWAVFGIFFGICLVLGTGSGSFKPVISATVGKTSSVEHRSLAYMVYYWFINLGAFSFPLITALAFLIVSFWVPDERVLYYYICFVAALLIIANYMVNRLRYENPDPPARTGGILKPFRNILSVLKDRRLAFFLLIYSGFFVMFSTMHLTIPLYMADFHIMPRWFSVLFLATVNPGAIILFGPYLSRFSRRSSPLALIVVGLAIYLMGLAFMGIAVVPFFFIAGIIIFSCGEFIAHPNYSSYISMIGRREKLAIYMGAAFLPSAMGYFIGGVICHGILYEEIAAVAQRPGLYWAVMVSIGLVTLAFLMIYNRKYGERVGTDDPVASKKRSFLTRTTHSNFTVIMVFLMIPGLIFMGYMAGEKTYYRGMVENGSGSANGLEGLDEFHGALEPLEGVSREHDTLTLGAEIPEHCICSVECILTWSDEPDAGQRYTNQPDGFTLNVTAPNGTSVESGPLENSHGREAALICQFSYSPGTAYDTGGTGDYVLKVICEECGDQEPSVNVFGLRTISDTGNIWTLEMRYIYLAAPQ